MEFSIDQGTLHLKDKGTARVDDESLSLISKEGSSFRFSLRDIVAIEQHNYLIDVNLPDGKVLLSRIGHQYEDLVNDMHRARNELILQDLLMHENLRKSGVFGEGRIMGASESERSLGRIEIRIYETGVVIMPKSGELIRCSFGDISGVASENYRLAIMLEDGHRIEIFKLGRENEPLRKAMVDALAELDLRTQQIIKEASPDEKDEVVRKLAGLMKEGRSAGRKEIEALSPSFWSALELRLKAAGIKDEYDFLLSKSRSQKAYVGIKRGLAREEADYLWFLIPLLDDESMVAMEATSEGGGRATYFFRDPLIISSEAKSRDTDGFIQSINRCILKINFRREPIYLSEEALLDPKFQRYRYSIIRIPELRQLRQQFLGRVFHISFEQWAADVEDLLKFSMSSKPGEKWSKNQVPTAEESGPI